MACRFTLNPKGVPIGCQISIPPFDMTSHQLVSLPGTDTHSNILRKMFTFQITSMIKRYPKTEEGQSKTVLLSTLSKMEDEVIIQNSSRLTHAQCRSFANSKIFSVAKTRYKNTRLSPKTSKVFPALSSSSKNPVPRINHGVNNDISTVLLFSYNKRNNNNKTKQNKHTHTHETQDET